MTEPSTAGESASSGPCRLRPDNFTPPARTPWGGHRIVGHYKRGLDLDVPASASVGESWEVSVEPSFPSRLVTGENLETVIRAGSRHWLGDHAVCFDGQLPLLVKLVDAGDHLSVQVHPTWDDPRLGPEESGKLECWLVLDADPGSGIYLGFREGVTPEAVAKCVVQNGGLDQLMNFVPVAPGDLYVLRPGTAHALGAGVTLVEPQLLSVGKKATTYRLWDWNRRYDPLGQPSVTGRPREVHVDQALQVIAWDGPRGEDFVASCRTPAGSAAGAQTLRMRRVSEQGLVLEQWQGRGSFDAGPLGSLCAVTCLSGVIEVDTDAGSLKLRRGESGVLPAAAGALGVELRDASATAVYLEL